MKQIFLIGIALAQTTTTIPPNPSGLCGPNSPVPTCIIGCCSAFGYCGTATAWCGANSGCLTQYSQSINGVNLCLAPQSTTTTTKNINPIPTQTSSTTVKTTTTKNINPIPTKTTTTTAPTATGTCPVYPDLNGVTGCTYGAITCSGTEQAVCNYVDINLNTAWVITPCSPGTQCSVIGVNNVICINSGSCQGITVTTTTKKINPIPTQTTTTKKINPIPTMTTTTTAPTSTGTCPVYPDLTGVTGCTSQAICNYVDVNYDTAYVVSSCGPGLQCLQVGINNIQCIAASSCPKTTTTTKNINPIPTQTTTKKINPIPTQTTSAPSTTCTANADLSKVTGCTFGQWACSGTQVAQCIQVDSNPLNNVYHMTLCPGTNQCQVLNDQYFPYNVGCLAC
ncbi:hypothetical protein HDV01_001933 [Terramyces sp. JEL0728]|nr:hypothetical protein HDV01_001933 [Terramyces sp. JEL0728]